MPWQSGHKSGRHPSRNSCRLQLITSYLAGSPADWVPSAGNRSRMGGRSAESIAVGLPMWLSGCVHFRGHLWVARMGKGFFAATQGQDGQDGQDGPWHAWTTKPSLLLQSVAWMEYTTLSMLSMYSVFPSALICPCWAPRPNTR